MERNQNRRAKSRMSVGMFAGAIAAVALLSTSQVSKATDLIPSVVMTRSLDDGSSMTTGAGLALRGPLVPKLLDLEIGASYHQSSADAGALKVRSWPISGSLWFAPASFLYAGGGLSLYNTTFDYQSELIQDETHKQLGAHIGGGVRVPVSNSIGLDAQGRYNFISPHQDKLTTKDLKAETWSTQLGLAIRF